MSDFSLKNNEMEFAMSLNDNKSEICPNKSILYLDEESKRLRVEELSQQYNVDHKRLIWKIDLCVLPAFMILYFIAFLNRSSFGLVLLDGITAALDCTQFEFCATYAAFLVPYIVLQFCSNLLLKKIRPHFWISIAVLAYGSLTLGSAFVHKYSHYVVIQVFHGIFQSAADTAIFYILAHYYERSESQKRFGIIFSVNSLAAMTGNFINYRITRGHLLFFHDLEPWRWLLIIEGSISVGCAFLLFFTIPDFPEGARFFNDNETLFLIKKLELYGGKSGYNLDFSKKEILKTAIDPLVYLPALSSFGIWYLFHGYSFYEPIIGVKWGYSSKYVTLLSAYIYIAAFVWCILQSTLSDYFGMRYLFVMINLVLAAVGILLMYCTNTDDPNNKAKIVASNFMASGSNAAIPLLLGWSTLNLGGHLRKSIAISLEIALGSVGGLIIVYAMQHNDEYYHRGMMSTLVCCILSMLFATAYFFLLRRENKKKRLSLYKDQFEQFSERKKMILGDKSPQYDYMY